MATYLVWSHELGETEADAKKIVLDGGFGSSEEAAVEWAEKYSDDGNMDDNRVPDVTVKDVESGETKVFSVEVDWSPVFYAAEKP